MIWIDGPAPPAVRATAALMNAAVVMERLRQWGERWVTLDSWRSRMRPMAAVVSAAGAAAPLAAVMGHEPPIAVTTAIVVGLAVLMSTAIGLATWRSRSQRAIDLQVMAAWSALDNLLAERAALPEDVAAVLETVCEFMDKLSDIAHERLKRSDPVPPSAPPRPPADVTP